MKPQISLRQALSDPLLLGNALSGATWKPWRTLLIAANGKSLIDDAERALFKQLTGREHEPMQQARIFAAAVGRRGGKSSAVGCYAAYLAGLCDHSDVLARGEKGILLVVATDVAVATIVKDRCAAALEGSPILRQLIVRQDDTTIELSNNISIECRPSSFRRLRGPTYIGAVLDELAFWYQDSSYANPDVEVIASIRPGLLTTGGPMCLVSSVYNKAGVLYDTWRKFYGVDNPNTLVAYGTSKDFNASLPQADIDAALEEDYARNAAELLSIWRSDLESYVLREAVEACVSRGVYERAPQPGVSYVGFVDPSGGSLDSFTCGIGHVDFTRDVTVIDALYERRPPFSPEIVVEEFSTALKRYNVITIVGDKYASIWPVEQFSKFGIVYEQSAAPKSDLYTNMLPMLNSARVELLDNQRLIAQLCALERRNSRGGKPSIDHAPNAHDDLANVVAGLVAINNKYGNYDSSFRGWSDDPNVDREAATARYQRQQLASYIFDLSGGRVWPG